MLASLVPPSRTYRSSNSIRQNSQPAVRPVAALTFGRAYPVSPRDYESADFIDDYVSQGLQRLHPAEDHLHQGGSTPPGKVIGSMDRELDSYVKSFDRYQQLKTQYPTAPEALNPKPATTFPFKLPLYNLSGRDIIKYVTFINPDGSPRAWEELRKARDEALTYRNIETYLRYKHSEENQKAYLDLETISEASAPHKPKSNLISPKPVNDMRGNCLNQYRESSQNINPYAKALPDFYDVAYSFMKESAQDKLGYFEYRISPTGNGIGGANGSNLEDVLSRVQRGFDNANVSVAPDKRVNYGIIILFERQNPRPSSPDVKIDPNTKVKKAEALAREVIRLKRTGKYNICGVDLAGDEANNPVTDFAGAFKLIQLHNWQAFLANRPDQIIGITIHAGETMKSGPLKGWQSIEKSIDIASDPYGITPVRIGHGLQVVDSSPQLRQAFEAYCQDPGKFDFTPERVQSLVASSGLLQKIINKKVCLEMCPKSNLQTLGIYPEFPAEITPEITGEQWSRDSYKRHPAIFMTRLGAALSEATGGQQDIRVSINSDNPTISRTNVQNEYSKLFKYSEMTFDDLERLYLEGFKSGFIQDPAKKAALIQKAKQELEDLKKDTLFYQKMQGTLPVTKGAPPSAARKLNNPFSEPFNEPFRPTVTQLRMKCHNLNRPAIWPSNRLFSLTNPLLRQSNIDPGKPGTSDVD